MAQAAALVIVRRSGGVERSRVFVDRVSAMRVRISLPIVTRQLDSVIASQSFIRGYIKEKEQFIFLICIVRRC
jgi:hypothetical protein